MFLFTASQTYTILVSGNKCDCIFAAFNFCLVLFVKKWFNVVRICIRCSIVTVVDDDNNSSSNNNKRRRDQREKRKHPNDKNIGQDVFNRDLKLLCERFCCFICAIKDRRECRLRRKRMRKRRDEERNSDRYVMCRMTRRKNNDQSEESTFRNMLIIYKF